MNINKLTGIVVTVFGLIYTALSFSLPRATVGKPLDPIIFPIICGIGLTLCGVGYYITRGMKDKSTTEKKEAKEVKKFSFKGMSLDNKLIIFTCAMGVLYGLLFDAIGYVLSTTLFMGALLFALNDGLKKWKTNILVALGFSVGIYVLFYYLLGIPLPPVPILNI